MVLKCFEFFETFRVETLTLGKLFLLNSNFIGLFIYEPLVRIN